MRPGRSRRLDRHRDRRRSRVLQRERRLRAVGRQLQRIPHGPRAEDHLSADDRRRYRGVLGINPEGITSPSSRTSSPRDEALLVGGVRGRDARESARGAQRGRDVVQPLVHEGEVVPALLGLRIEHDGRSNALRAAV